MPEKIAYRKGYRYQLAWDYELQLEYEGVGNMVEGGAMAWTWLATDGKLLITAGYAWDGASGPAMDTPTIMRAALVHDALYQLIRLGSLDKHIWKPRADKELRRICREDGMSRFRSWYVYQAVRLGGGKAASPAGIRPVLYAPKEAR
jgi:hypothetical protein